MELLDIVDEKGNPTGETVPREVAHREDVYKRQDEQVECLLDAIRDLPPYVFVMIGLYAGPVSYTHLIF